MNKLSSCETFKLVNEIYKGGITKTLANILAPENIDKYKVDMSNYDHLIKSMKLYKYPLSQRIILSATRGNIGIFLLADPVNQKDKPVVIPPMLFGFSGSSGKGGYIDISGRSSYVRDNVTHVIQALKVKEIDLYGYFQSCYIEYNLKKYDSELSESRKFLKAVARAYSTLFVRCISATYPINTDIIKLQNAHFLAASFCLQQMFGKEAEKASNFLFSSGLSNRVDITNNCQNYREGKMEFTDINDFLEKFTYEFKDMIDPNGLKLRNVGGLYQKMYSTNAFFAMEHAYSFINMCMSAVLGINFFRDKSITKLISREIKDMESVFVSTFSN